MRIHAVFIGVVFVTGLAAGCERDGESLRAQLAARQASWEQQIGAIKAQHAALKERFERKIAAANAPEATSPAAMRMRVVVDGTRQSLVDVEMQMRQVGPRLEEEIRRGGDAAEKLLEAETGRMNDYLQGMAADIGALGRGLDDFGNAERSNNGKTSEE